MPDGRSTARRCTRRTRWIGLILLSFLLALLIAPTAAEAHAVLVRSSPVDGSRLQDAPSAVRLVFDEPVQIVPGRQRVISRSGARADTGSARLVGGGTTLVLPLKPGLPRGTYSASWRVVSADSHVVSGAITFGIGVEPGAVAAGPVDHSRALRIADGVGTGLIYLGLVLLIGVLVAIRLLGCPARRVRRIGALTWIGWAALVLGSAAFLLLQGPQAAGAGWPAVWRGVQLGETLRSRTGVEVLLRLGLLVVVLPVLRPLRRGARWAELVGAAIALCVTVSVVLTGHESVGSMRWLAVPSATVHLAAMALWLGGLIALTLVVLPAVRAGDLDPPPRLSRWSVIAYSCVAALILTGEYQASRQIDPVASLWSTRYGVILCLKLGAVLLILAAALLAQRRVARTGGDAAATARGITHSVRIEAAAAVLVLGLTAWLVSAPPARTSYGPSVQLAAPLGPDRALVHLDRSRRGPVRLQISLIGGGGDPVPADQVSATFSSPEVSALPVRLARSSRDGSSWRSIGTVVPLPGIWTVTLDVELSSVTAYTTAAHYRVW